ncbi:MAG: GNAT family N-acetyltransferase [Thermoleophilia bacterium]|nr:GNAT family N-acetyltransferase [Thermoleophilia bacterium]
MDDLHEHLRIGLERDQEPVGRRIDIEGGADDRGGVQTDTGRSARAGGDHRVGGQVRLDVDVADADVDLVAVRAGHDDRWQGGGHARLEPPGHVAAQAGTRQALYEESGRPEVTYWIGKPYWGKGLATRALSEFLARVNKTRPIYARVAKDNIGSRRVLEKCGFTTVGEAKGFANARDEEIEELIMERSISFEQHHALNP